MGASKVLVSRMTQTPQHWHVGGSASDQVPLGAGKVVVDGEDVAVELVGSTLSGLQVKLGLLPELRLDGGRPHRKRRLHHTRREIIYDVVLVSSCLLLLVLVESLHVLADVNPMVDDQRSPGLLAGSHLPLDEETRPGSATSYKKRFRIQRGYLRAGT